MSISREMKLLYQSLGEGLNKDFPIEKDWIEGVLSDPVVRNDLEVRTKVAELVGIIKFVHNMPIFVPEVEQKIVEGIQSQSKSKNLNQAITVCFFKLVMEHSKAVQTRLGELLKGKPSQAKQMLDEVVASLKTDRPNESKQLDGMSLSKDSLQLCRGLIQHETDGVLDEMVVVSRNVAPTRNAAMLRDGLFGTKTFSGAAQLWSFNIDPASAPADVPRANSIPNSRF